MSHEYFFTIFAFIASTGSFTCCFTMEKLAIMSTKITWSWVKKSVFSFLCVIKSLLQVTFFSQKLQSNTIVELWNSWNSLLWTNNSFWISKYLLQASQKKAFAIKYSFALSWALSICQLSSYSQVAVYTQISWRILTSGQYICVFVSISKMHFHSCSSLVLVCSLNLLLSGVFSPLILSE